MLFKKTSVFSPFWQNNSAFKSLYASSSSSSPFFSTTSSPFPNNNSNEHQSDDPVSPHRYSLVRPLYSLILKSKLTADPDLARFLAKSGAISIYSLAGMTALGTLGVDTAPLLTGIGITGFTVGFALKEVATNFLSGVMLVFGKPFRKGQWLKVLGSTTAQLEGEVQSIDARYVLLRTKDKSLVMIPSVVVYTNPILVSNPVHHTESNDSNSPSSSQQSTSTSSSSTSSTNKKN
jgi:small-conductance mechanosensitive channel